MPMPASPLSALEQQDEFIGRHIGPCAGEIAAMLATVGASSLEQLIDETIPAAIRLPRRPAAALPPCASTRPWLPLKAIAGRNRVNRSLIGMGYYDTLTPKVILRNVLETPAGIRPTPLPGRKSPRAGWRRC